MERRFAEHLAGGKKGAKYTRIHTPEKIEAVWKAENRSEASRLEWRVKHLTKQQKEALCEAPERVAEFVPVGEARQVEVVREM